MARSALLRGLSGRAPCCLRAVHGLVEVRRKGSHMIMSRPRLATPSRYPRPTTDAAYRHVHVRRGQSRLSRSLSERAGASLKRMPTMTNAAMLIPVQPWVPVQSRSLYLWPQRTRVEPERQVTSGAGDERRRRKPCASISAPATVPCRAARPIRGRLGAGAPAGHRPAGAVITPGGRRRCRCDHARAAALARPDVEAQPAHP